MMFLRSNICQRCCVYPTYLRFSLDNLIFLARVIFMRNNTHDSKDNDFRRLAKLEQEVERLKTELEQSRAVEKGLLEQLLSTTQHSDGHDRSEAELHRQRELWQRLFERIPIMITMYHPDLQFMQLNPSFEQITGWTTDDANHGGDFMAKVYPDPEYRRMVAEFMQSLQEGWRDFQLTGKDGSVIESAWSNIRLADDTQIGIGIDLRERKRIDQALREGEDRFRIMANGTPVIMWVHDAAGGIEFVNRAYQDFFGVDEEEVKSGGWQPLVHPDDSAAYIDVFQECLRERKHFRAQGRVRRKDGQWRWVNSQGQSHFSASGEFLGMAGSSMDITDQKQVNEALRASEERFRVALKNAPVLVYTTDLDLRYTWMYAPTNGFRAEEVLGKLDEELLLAEDVQELVDFKRSVLESREGARAEVHLPFQGQMQTYNVTAEPLLDSGGKMVGLTVAAVDMTEVLELKAEMVRSEERIEIQRRISDDYEKERARIARDLHDGPLQELISTNFQISMIQSEEDEAERSSKLKQLSEMLEEQAVSLRSFCNELRPPALAPFGLEKAIRSHIDQVKERHPNIEIKARLDADRNTIPENTRMILYRIYQEGMNNMLKHANASEARVCFYLEDGRAQLELQDKGKGFAIPESWVTLARQGHLGLVGMRERVENIGGELLVQSAPGEGTIVRVTVPLDPRES